MKNSNESRVLRFSGNQNQARLSYCNVPRFHLDNLSVIKSHCYPISESRGGGFEIIIDGPPGFVNELIHGDHTINEYVLNHIYSNRTEDHVTKHCPSMAKCFVTKNKKTGVPVNERLYLVYGNNGLYDNFYGNPNYDPLGYDTGGVDAEINGDPHPYEPNGEETFLWWFSRFIGLALLFFVIITAMMLTGGNPFGMSIDALLASLLFGSAAGAGVITCGIKKLYRSIFMKIHRMTDRTRDKIMMVSQDGRNDYRWHDMMIDGIRIILIAYDEDSMPAWAESGWFRRRFHIDDSSHVVIGKKSGFITAAIQDGSKYPGHAEDTAIRIVKSSQYVPRPPSMISEALNDLLSLRKTWKAMKALRPNRVREEHHAADHDDMKINDLSIISARIDHLEDRVRSTVSWDEATRNTIIRSLDSMFARYKITGARLDDRDEQALSSLERVIGEINEIKQRDVDEIRSAATQLRSMMNMIQQ